MSAARWLHIWDLLDERGLVMPVDLARMCDSFHADERLLALCIMRRQINYYGPAVEYLDAVRECVEDVDEDIRWQSMMVLAELARWYPQLLWGVIRMHGESADGTTRHLVMNFLLKHIMEHHAATFQSEIDAWTKQSAKVARNYAMRLMSTSR